MRNRTQKLRLVIEAAIATLKSAPLPPDDRADFYDGLGVLLPETEAEAAIYAATCIRESQRAQRDFLAVIEARKGAA